jgi:hypothetical protein
VMLRFTCMHVQAAGACQVPKRPGCSRVRSPRGVGLCVCVCVRARTSRAIHPYCCCPSCLPASLPAAAPPVHSAAKGHESVALHATQVLSRRSCWCGPHSLTQP